MKRIISLSLVLLFVLVCMAVPTLAEEPISHVTESSGNGYALYNGIKLPNIDTVWTDKSTYPYAVIFDGTESEGIPYCLVFTDTMVSLQSNGDIIGALVSGDFYYSMDGISWISAGLFGTEVLNTAFIWASNAILNVDGTTYLDASSPIPLDGMTVIEWDGVTDELTSTEGPVCPLYLVSTNCESAVSCLAVQVSNIDNSRSIFTDFILADAGWNISNWVIGVVNSGVYFGNDGECYISFAAYTPAGSDPENPTDPTDPAPDLEAPAVSWSFTDRELIVSEYHPIVAITDIGADGQCVLYSRSLNSDGTTSEWTPYMTDEVMKGDSGIDMCAFDLYPDESKVPYSMQYKAVVTLGSGTNTATAETDVLTIHWVKSSTVDPTEPTIDGGGSSGDVDSDDDVPMLQAIWQAITDGFNNVGVWFSAQFNAINTWGQDIVDAINNGFGSMNDLESNVDEFQESVNQQGSQLEDMAEAMGAVTRPDVSTAIPDISGFLTVTGPVTLAAVFDPFWKNSYILRLLLASLAVSVAFTVVYGGKK